MVKFILNDDNNKYCSQVSHVLYYDNFFFIGQLCATMTDAPWKCCIAFCALTSTSYHIPWWDCNSSVGINHVRQPVTSSFALETPPGAFWSGLSTSGPTAVLYWEYSLHNHLNKSAALICTGSSVFYIFGFPSLLCSFWGTRTPKFPFFASLKMSVSLPPPLLLLSPFFWDGGSYYIAQHGLELLCPRCPSASASYAAGPKRYTSMPGLKISVFYL